MTSAGLWNMSDSPSESQGLQKSSPGISAGCHTPHPGSGVAELEHPSAGSVVSESLYPQSSELLCKRLTHLTHLQRVSRTVCDHDN